jgi:ketosteroid isomerase-like protein
MVTARNADERLREIYQLLRETLEPSNGDAAAETRWQSPPMPLDVDGRTSATDLLSWWYRPPSGEESAWDRYFGDPKGSMARPIAPLKETRAGTSTSNSAHEEDMHSHAAVGALVDWPAEDLPNQDAEIAIEVFYAFLHALGQKDVAGAMQYVADDYHVFENDREFDRRDLRSSLEVLLESLHGSEFEVSLAMVPEPLGHPYGIVMYVEIQIDITNPRDGAKRNVLERRLVLLQKQADFAFKIAAFSKPRS